MLWTIRRFTRTACLCRDVPCQTAMCRVGQWFGPCRASPAPRHLISVNQPSSPTPHFYRQGPGQPEPNPSLLLANPSLLLANPSLLLVRPLTSISQTPRFYLPGQAAPCRTVSAPCPTVPCQYWPCRRVGLTLAHPHIMRAFISDVTFA